MTCIPHKANTPGDFYVEDGCCTSCGMPMTVAPDLFEYEPDGHCFVRKQPSAPDEVDRMILAFEVQDVGCIRYKGSNRTIQIRLVEIGEGPQCDQLDSELSARNSAMQMKRAAAFAIWKAKQKEAEQTLVPDAENSPSLLRRVLRRLGLRA